MLPSELKVSAEELVSEWNADAECQALAEARAESDPSKFDGTFIAVLGAVAGALATSALYDLLEGAVLRVIQKKKVNKRLEVTKSEQDGVSLLIVKSEESS